MNFVTYVDEFGDTQYFRPELVTHTQCHHFEAKDENFDVPKEYRGTVVGLNTGGYCISRETSDVIMARIQGALNGAS